MTNEEIKLIEVPFQKVSVKPDDVIVVMYKQTLSEAAVKHIIELIETNFPDNKTMILEEGMKIGVMAKSED